MKNVILVILICSLLANNAFAAVVSGKNNKEYSREQSNQFITKDEVNKWSKEMQFWFDNGARIELLLKVASYSEVHGYISENWDRQSVIDEYERLRHRATDSNLAN